MSPRALRFAIPGDLSRRTGGYGYDRRLIAALEAAGRRVEVVRLGDGFPDPPPAERAAAAAVLAAIPDGAPLLVDGLAGGVLDGELAAASGRLALVYLCHHPLGLETGLDPDRAAALLARERRALAAAAAVVVTSTATARTLAADLGVPAERISVAVPGTDPQPQAPGGGDPPVLLTVATLIRRKGHDVLVDALARLKDLAFESRIVGGEVDPAFAARIKAAVAAAGLSEKVRFLGEVADPSEHYASADVFVLPSRYEGYGMVFAEALARGLPVVAARAGAVPEVVPEAAGALVPPDDPEALAAALRRLLVDADARARARRASRAAGLALPDWTATARIVEAVIERATRPAREGARQ